MIPIEIDLFFLFYLGAGLSSIFGLWFYYDYRDGRFYKEESQKTTFHCIKCNRIYNGAFGNEECDCPECGFTNGRLGF